MKNGPPLCRNSGVINADLDFRVTQAFDSSVISAELSPAGIVNLTRYSWAIVMAVNRMSISFRKPMSCVP